MAVTTHTNFRMLRSVFDDRMNRLDRSSDAADSASAETELAKTYLLETTEHGLPEKKHRAALKEIFSTAPTESTKAIQVAFAESDRLMQVSCRYRGKRVVVYVDFRDRRFLRLHSTSKSELLEEVVLGWTDKLPELDHAWFDDGFLEWCSKLGEFRGIGVEFSNAPLTSPDLTSAELDDSSREESIRLRQSGKAAKMLALLRSSNDFSEQSSLSMVRIKNEDSNRHVFLDVRFDGRVVGRGNSFARHVELADRIVEKYRSRVLTIESDHAQGGVGCKTGFRLTGRPIRIAMLPRIDNVRLFCDRVFAAINPFRLVGMPREVAADHFIVPAVDLHTAQTIRFEVMPDSIMVYLPVGTCGNTLLRFLTNLQRHHGRRVSAPKLNGASSGAL